MVAIVVTGLSYPEPASAQTSPSPFDSARVELNRGRAWHAARLIRATAELDALTPRESLLLARSEAGWRNWSGVIAVLDGASWLGELDGAVGEYLLGVAFARLESWERAERWLSSFESRSGQTREGGLARSRLARVRVRAGKFEEAVATLEGMSRDPAQLRAWTALEVARSASRAAEPEVVRSVLRFSDDEAYSRGWALEGEALLRAGDSAAALSFFRVRAPSLASNSRRAWALMMTGELLQASGETEEARASFEGSIEAFPQGMSGSRSARGLLEVNGLSAELSLRLARILARAGDAERAVEAYDLHFAGLDDAPSAELRFARARQLALADRHEDAVREFRVIVDEADSTFQLRVLDEWVDVRRDQGRQAAARTVQGWILERFPGSDQAAEILFYRGDALQDRRSYDQASALYRSALETGSTRNLAGLSWMRLGLLELERGRRAEAAEIFLSYAERFSDGRRWDQATFWAGRALAEAEGSAEGEPYFRSLLEKTPMSYYAVLAAAELEESFSVEVPEAGPATDPAPWMREDLVLLDLLTEAELTDATSWLVGQMRARVSEAVDDRPALAEALIERGYAVEGIRLGQAHIADGQRLDSRLLRIIYPFPFREVILAESRERGLDPFFLAGLIRQESVFDADVVSRAGAVGLMQVMPATGRQLARSERIEGFSTESLETPEINLHLGVNFWLDLERRFQGGHVPLRLSAYNAGPTRARRWRTLPENADALRFTERIPFEETRGYVKAVLRNAALYRALYADEFSALAEGSPGRSGF
jgi:peptidoglycan lytic transglycosylase